MEGIHRSRALVYWFDGLLLLLCVLGGYRFMQRAGMPLELADAEGKVYCFSLPKQESDLGIKRGDWIKQIDGHAVQDVEDVEFYLGARRIGDVIDVEIVRENESRLVPVRLTPSYNTAYLIVVSFSSALFVLIGIFVYTKRPGDTAAVIFHWGAVTAAVMMLTTSDSYVSEPRSFEFIQRSIFYLAYGFIAPIFFHFTLVFPRTKWHYGKRLVPVLYGSALAIAAWTMWMFVNALYSSSLHDVQRFTFTFSTTRWFFIVLGTAALVSFFHSYRTVRDEVDRRKLRWILWGLILGFLPFVVFWVIPQIFIARGIFPEEFLLLALAIIPVSFAISIVKYHIMDINLILNRSVVYVLVVGSVLIMYALIVGIATLFVAAFTVQSSLMISAVASIVVALLFNPVRTRIQGIVDRRFFRVQYDFREAQRRFVDDIKACFDVQQLARLIVGRTNEIIYVERLGFFVPDSEGGKLALLSHLHYDILESRRVRFQRKDLRVSLQRPVALSDEVETGVEFESADKEVFHRWGIAIIFPLASEAGEPLGFFVLGRKKSGARYTLEDVDLLRTVTTQAAFMMERITLQRRLMLEQTEAHRLEELNRLKSYFVSSVSHDLKTPLTSIKIFAERLQAKKRIGAKQEAEALEIIIGESERLTRLINNVLDFARIERGIKEYRFDDVSLNDIVTEVLRSMRYQLKMAKCKVKTKMVKRTTVIHADADAVHEAIVNLVTNAVKYSVAPKEISVSTVLHDGHCSVSIGDKGIGIAKNQLASLFEPFFRVKAKETQQVGGVGLGLSIVKHIMDAHGGSIEVKSIPGKGSTFTLFFPLKTSKHQNGKAR